jgi:hypothetical protein
MATRSQIKSDTELIYVTDNIAKENTAPRVRSALALNTDNSLNLDDDNITPNDIGGGGDGSLEYTSDPTGSWDGSIVHDLKIPTKKYVDDNSGAITLENGLSLSGGIGKLGGDLTENTSISLHDSIAVADRDLSITYLDGITTRSILELNGDATWSIGSDASSSLDDQVVIGKNAQTTSAGGIAIGNNANAGAGLTTIAIGDGADVTGVRGISIGFDSESEQGVSIGIGAFSTGAGISIGQSSSTGGIAIGTGSTASSGFAVAGGNVTGLLAQAIGNSNVSGVRSVSVGDSNNIAHTDCHIVGSLSSTLGNNAYIFGRNNKAGNNGISFGFSAGSTSGTLATDVISFGRESNSGTANAGANSIAIGSFTDSVASGAIIIGKGISNVSTLSNNVANSFGFGWDENTPSFLYSKAGQWLVKNLPTFADDAAAGGGGVATDEIYKTATGELRIKL